MEKEKAKSYNGQGKVEKRKPNDIMDRTKWKRESQIIQWTRQSGKEKAKLYNGQDKVEKRKPNYLMDRTKWKRESQII